MKEKEQQDYRKYGHFSDDKKEFVIHRPDTPAPWVNYISNGRYSGLVSHTGGGYSFYGNPKDNRITRWRYNALPADRPGRYILIRDKKNGEYWSPTWQPTCREIQNFRCRHGLYYTIISSDYRDISASIRYFVPADDLEIWSLTLQNNSEQTRNFDLFAFQELCLGHALVDLINQPNDQHFNEVHFDRASEILYATKRYWVKYNRATVAQPNEAWDKTVFFASSLPVQGWDGSKQEFIGRWRSEADPIAVEKGQCSNSEITAGDAIGALQLAVQLEPGQGTEVAFLLGVIPKTNFQDNAEQLVRKYRSTETIEKAFRNQRNNWEEYLGGIRVETPSEEANTMLNVWNQYQTSVTFRFSRDASYYHGGLLFGRGYRDSCQDIMGPVMTRPDWVRERILEMSKYQFIDGSTFHLYYPMTGGGERTGHSDTPLWLPLAIMVYLKETGDFDLLNVSTPFYEDGEAPILKHYFGAIDYTLSNLTEKHLARFGPGDWNDTLDYLGRKGRGESVWVTMFLAYILREAVQFCEYLGDQNQAEYYRGEYEKIKKALNQHCWDGAWYTRGTTDWGEIVGSAQNDEGRIFLNTQSWAIISGIASEERARTCMDSVRAHLDTPKGPKILHPAYTQPDDHIGLATRCVPGKKENGAVFNHPVSWAILAECLLGHGDRAFEIYQKALPMNPVIDIDRYEVEPYVYAEYVTSPDHPSFGQASHSWLTGSSTWMLRGATDYILGIRPEYTGLRIDPCIPKDWRKYRVRRKFRGILFDISVRNPDQKNGGVQSMTLEDRAIRGDFIDLADDSISAIVKGKKLVHVKVTL